MPCEQCGCPGSHGAGLTVQFFQPRCTCGDKTTAVCPLHYAGNDPAGCAPTVPVYFEVVPIG